MTRATHTAQCCVLSLHHAHATPPFPATFPPQTTLICHASYSQHTAATQTTTTTTMTIFSLEQASWTYFDQTHSTPFNAGIFFSDGGSKHFKCCYTMALLAAIANPSTIHPSQPIAPWISDIIDADVLLKLQQHPHEVSYHFCASYHGHSLADGHFSQLKRLSNQAYVASAYEINNKQPHHTSHHFNPLGTAHEFVLYT